ncbi:MULTISPECIES: hypothetical protein [unclassified Streptomyces]|uniref:hypothetical protein n=1 Tax=unclassified Streptomyces TaxID=2593676 RepID=UPI002E78785F|nr:MULTISPECIES: hypothetical protein [unclassified Streptomyces]MEE1758229.1 hypothetical protein [Streptomyces sp. SP18BB07]MEE1832715.1 hypothetical protein [Streptomyces sp. SP17KL33]
MQGHGYAPTPPPGPDQGGQVTLRVIFVVVAVMSCGLLAWACLLRLASVTRRPHDWCLFALAIIHIIVTLYIIGTDPGKDEFTTWRGDVGMGLLLGGLAAIVAYYLYADIRHFSRARTVQPSPYAQTTLYSGQTGYGPQQSGYSYPPVQVPQPYTPTPPVPQPPVQQPPQQHQQAPEPGRPGPARIDQVRAELDELSDYLRNHEGDR